MNLEVNPNAHTAPAIVWNTYDIPRRTCNAPELQRLSKQGITAQVLKNWGRLNPARQHDIRQALGL